MSSNSSFNESQQIIQSLITTFPNCFSKEGTAQPLKIGIFQDLVVALELEKAEAVISKVKLRRALRVYTEQWRYLHGFVVGAKRVGLLGELGDELKPEEVEFAQKHLAESKERYMIWKKSVADKQKSKAPKKAVQKEKAKVDKFKKASTDSNVDAKSNATANIERQSESLKKDLTEANLQALKVGDLVYVQMSARPVKGNISEIEKATAKVKLESGMELSIPAQLIFIKK